jgi:hypothetical protein
VGRLSRSKGILFVFDEVILTFLSFFISSLCFFFEVDSLFNKAFHLLIEQRPVYFIVRWYFGQIEQTILSKIVCASSSVEFV